MISGSEWLGGKCSVGVWKMGNNLCEKYEFDRRDFGNYVGESDGVRYSEVLWCVFAVVLWRCFEIFLVEARVLTMCFGWISVA